MVNGNAANLTKCPTRLKPTTSASNLRLDIGETVCLNTSDKRRILDALWLAKTVLAKKIRKQLAACLKRLHFHWRFSECFPLGGHKINSVTRTPNDQAERQPRQPRTYPCTTNNQRPPSPAVRSSTLLGCCRSYSTLSPVLPVSRFWFLRRGRWCGNLRCVIGSMLSNLGSICKPDSQNSSRRRNKSQPEIRSH